MVTVIPAEVIPTEAKSAMDPAPSATTLPLQRVESLQTPFQSVPPRLIHVPFAAEAFMMPAAINAAAIKDFGNANFGLIFMISISSGVKGDFFIRYCGDQERRYYLCKVL